LREAYNLVRIRKGDEWKTAFRTRYGLFEYLVMPFGLTNTSATFQQFVNSIFRDILDSFVICYLDDIVIFSENEQNHVEHVKIVLERLLANGFYAKFEKCLFEADKIEFAGYITSSEGIQMDTTKIKCILNWASPSNIFDIQSF
jgi:Reverse transcriptase (RNA-dependent DNA polymerase)